MVIYFFNYSCNNKMAAFRFFMTSELINLFLLLQDSYNQNSFKISICDSHTAISSPALNPRHVLTRRRHGDTISSFK